MNTLLLIITITCLITAIYHRHIGTLTQFFLQLTVCVMIIQTFIFQVKKVTTHSMIPSIQPGQSYIVQPLSFGIKLPFMHHAISSTMKLPDYGDVVATRFPPDPSYVFVKRVVALPGDEVQYQDEVLYVNGIPVTGQQSICTTENINDVKYSLVYDPKATTRNVSQVVVPPNHVYLLGDNRDHSQDSRYWGAVPLSLLEGEVISSFQFAYPYLDFDYQSKTCDITEDDFVRITDYYVTERDPHSES